nr:MAG TPA: hypothetical protein [Caudoviricetes sp.]
MINILRGSRSSVCKIKYYVYVVSGFLLSKLNHD